MIEGFSWSRIQPTDFPANKLGAPIDVHFDEGMLVIQQEEQYAVHMMFVEPDRIADLIEALEAAKNYIENNPGRAT